MFIQARLIRFILQPNDDLCFIICIVHVECWQGFDIYHITTIFSCRLNSKIVTFHQTRNPKGYFNHSWKSSLHSRCRLLLIKLSFFTLRHWNTGLVSSGASLTSWGKGSSLALVGDPSSDAVTINKNSLWGRCFRSTSFAPHLFLLFWLKLNLALLLDQLRLA